MKIAVMSGKGGTGKTLVAVNLAAAGGRCVYADCDVEEPDGRLFLNPGGIVRREVGVNVPAVDAEKCLGCRVCVQFCRFGALAFVSGKPLLTPGVCHGCGGCATLCPVRAISEQMRPIGAIERGDSGEIRVATGVLNPGEASGVPLIHALLSELDGAETVFLDCPPGVSCAAMACARAADLVVLVAEPTRYGAENLKMADELCAGLGKRRVAVLNKRMPGAADPSEVYCEAAGIPVAARIPYDPELARLNALGILVSEKLPWVKALFRELRERLMEEARVQ